MGSGRHADPGALPIWFDVSYIAVAISGTVIGG
jgi:hypothetical protein